MKIRNKLFIGCLVILIIPFISGCLSYKYSNKRKNESVTCEKIYSKKGIIPGELLAQDRPEERSRGIGITQIATFAVDIVKKLIDLDKKLYTADYSTGLGSLYFYDYFSTRSAFDPKGMVFDGFSILRTVKTRHNEQDTALYIAFRVDDTDPNQIINNSVFGLKIDTLVINYSKAKVPAVSWFLPWTYYYLHSQKLNLDFEITLISTWVTEGGEVFYNIPIGKFYLSIRNAPLNRKDKSYHAYYSDLSGKPLEGYSFLVPRSFGYYMDNTKNLNPCYGQGFFNIAVRVAEAGKEKFVTKILQENSDAILNGLKTKVSNVGK